MNNNRLKSILFWICLVVAIISFFPMVMMLSPWWIVGFVLSLIGTGVFAEIGDGFFPHPPVF